MEHTLSPSEDELMAREEQTRKGLKVLARAIVMRLLVTAVLLWAMVSSGAPHWALGLLALVLVLNLAGAMPLLAEFKRLCRQLRNILDQYE